MVKATATPEVSITAEGETRLNDDITLPSTTKPGDGPADTTDPLERASSVVPTPSAEAAAIGTVNSSIPLEPITPKALPDDEFEEYDVTLPSGAKGRVKHNLITGASELVKAEAPAAE